MPLAYVLFLVAVGILVFAGPLFWMTIFFNVILIYLACFFMLSFLERESKVLPVVTKWPMMTILIPAYNRGSSLRTCLQKVLAMEYPGKREIIVINDASTDQTKEILAEFKGEIRVITNPKNIGKARSLNNALRFAKGELVTAIDGDSFPAPDCLVRMVPHFYANKEIGGVTTIVRVNNRNGILQHIQELEYFLAFGLHNSVLSAHDAIYVTPGPLSMYRKTALDEMGGWDPTNITEDMEITFHLHSLGYKVVLEPNAHVYTDVPTTIPALWRQRKRWSFGSWQTMFKYRHELFSPKKRFFTFFFPERMILEGSSVIFLFMVFRMLADLLSSITSTLGSAASVGFETISIPAWYMSSSAILYVMLLLLWLALIVFGLHISGERMRKLSIPGLLVFIGVYGIFIITVQAYSLVRVVANREQTW